jgi:hypothetical protein
VFLRQYVIDEVSSPDIEKINDYLRKRLDAASLDDLYWLEMKPDMLSDLQTAHKACQPHAVAVEVGENWVKFELLVRSRMKLHCRCYAYALPAQRDYIMEVADRMVQDLRIRT